MDVESLFKESFTKSRKEDQAKYFLMKVAQVRPVANDPDSFMALGFRVDNDQKVAVVGKKSASGQHMPSPGSVLRAEKVTRVPTKAGSDIAVYKAEYFHTYLQDSLCLQAVIQASAARFNEQSKMWSAQVHAYDVDTNDVMLSADKTFTDLDQQLVKILMPWKADEASTITHDVKGDAVWGDGLSGRQGLSPFAVIRLAGQSISVYGKGSVKQDKNGEVSFRLPSEQEVLSYVQGNEKLQSLKSVIKSLPAQELPKLKIALIPGLSISVGRDSLAGSERKYLAIPKAFDWVNRDKQDEKGNPVIQPGFRLADVHVKFTRTGRMMVVDAVPSVGGYLAKTIPDSSHERDVQAAMVAYKAAEAARNASPAQDNADQLPDSTAAAQQPEPQNQQHEKQAAPKTARSDKQSVDNRAPNHFDQVPDDDGDHEMPDSDSSQDYDMFSDDLAAMESMNSSAEPQSQADDSVDDLLNEAAQRIETRRPSRPSM